MDLTLQHNSQVALIVNGQKMTVRVVSEPMTRKSLALHYEVDERTIDKWTAKRWIPFRKIGKVVRFYLPEVESALMVFKKHEKKFSGKWIYSPPPEPPPPA